MTIGAVAVAAVFWADAVSAQGGPVTGACVAGNGVRITTVVGTGASGSAGSTVLALTDTTLVFNYAERSWTRTDFAAMVDVGWASEDRRRINVCAGVSIEMSEATIVVRGARGRIHFRASLDRLTQFKSASTASGASLWSM